MWCWVGCRSVGAGQVSFLGTMSCGREKIVGDIRLPRAKREVRLDWMETHNKIHLGPNQRVLRRSQSGPCAIGQLGRSHVHLTIYMYPTIPPFTHLNIPLRNHVQRSNVVGALLHSVHAIRRLAQQAILTSTAKVLPTVTQLNTTATWLALENDIPLGRFAWRVDGQPAWFSANS
jgi:hypothetical protein